jgi:hypothetical protein
MSDKCFICLSNTRTRSCTQCNIKCHRKCWETYVNEYSKTVKPKCPQCKIVLEQKKIMTRSVKRSMDKRLSNKEIVTKVKKLLKKSESINDSHKRQVVAREIFLFLLDNMYFIEENDSFRGVVKEKLIELSVSKWDYAKDMYMTMFGEQIR